MEETAEELATSWVNDEGFACIRRRWWDLCHEVVNATNADERVAFSNKVARCNWGSRGFATLMMMCGEEGELGEVDAEIAARLLDYETVRPYVCLVLIKAIEWHKTDLVKLVLASEHCDPSARNNDAIVQAASKGLADIVELLLADDRVDPTVHANYALYVAVEEGYDDVAKLLGADHRIGPNMVINVKFSYAVEEGRVEEVEQMLADPRLDPTFEENDAIRVAVRNRREASNEADKERYEAIIALLFADERVVPGVENSEVVCCVAKYDIPDLMELLLADPRVDPTIRDNEPIRLASGRGRAEAVKLLLADPRVDPAANDNEAIRLAAKNGRTDVVALLANDPRVDASVLEE